MIKNLPEPFYPMIKNLVIITSVINTSKNPLSYTNNRSVYTYNERLHDTQKTIESVKKYIPDCKVFLIECSNLEMEHEVNLKTSVDYYENLVVSDNIVRQTSSISKSMGEGVMTIEALKYISLKNIEYENLFKISGRYWLNENFNYSDYNNDMICIHRIQENYDNVFTCFYKLPKNIVSKWYLHLLNSFNEFRNCVGYELIFGAFINNLKDVDKKEIKKVGINGYVSVAREFIDM